MLPLVVVLFSVCSSELRTHELTTPVQGTDREIVLADVLLFRISREQAYENWRWCRDHKDEFRTQVETWNTPMRVWHWSQECDWRYQCWRELSDALDQTRNSYYRVHDLYRLRDLLGREAFYSGVMPSPIPNYKILPNR